MTTGDAGQDAVELSPASRSYPRPRVAELLRAGSVRLAGLGLLVAGFLSLAWLGHAQPVVAGAFVICSIATWAGYAIFFCVRQSPSAIIVRLSFAVAIAVRIAGLMTPPIYEDDWARYLWDGHRLIEDGTPYAHPPAQYLEDAGGNAAWRAVLDQVNNPDVPTIYAPGLQYVFALSSWLAPASIEGLKSILVIFDLGLCAIVWRLGGVSAALRYALCPLVVFEVAFNAHADIIGATLAVACYALARARHDVAAGAVFGLALACKPFAVIVAPALVGRRWGATALAAAAVLFALYAAFIWKGATELAGLEIFSRWWEFNSLGFAVVEAAVGDTVARPLSLVLGVTLSASLMLYWRLREADTLPPADLWLLALLCLAPVINPWYLLWAVPWVCLRSNALTWAALPAVSVSYLTAGVLGIDGAAFYDHPVWVRPLEVVLWAAIVAGLFAWQRSRPVQERAPAHRANALSLDRGAVGQSGTGE